MARRGAAEALVAVKAEAVRGLVRVPELVEVAALVAGAGGLVRAEAVQVAVLVAARAVVLLQWLPAR